MKKIILATVLIISSLSFGQKTKKAVSTKPKVEVKKREFPIELMDFQTKGDKLFINQNVKFKAGDDKEVDVMTFIAIEKSVLDSLGISKLNDILDVANIKAKYSVKNKYTYIPRKISLLYSNDKLEYTANVEFTAQNNYGALKDANSFFIFDSKGEFLNKL